MTTSAASEPKLKQLMIAAWLRHDNTWMTSAEILKILPSFDNQRIYAEVSTLSKKGILDKKPNPDIPRSFLYRISKTHKIPDEVKALAPKTTVVPEGIKGKKTKVFWKPHEQIALAEEVARLKLQTPFSPLTHLLNLAQLNTQILPEDRRRTPITTIESVLWLEPLLATVKPKQEKPIEEIKPPMPINVSELSTGILIDEVVKRLGGMLSDVIIQVLTNPEVAKLLKPSTTPVIIDRRHNPYGMSITPAEPRLEKMLVVGLLKPNHVEEIKKEFDEVFNMKFYHPDQATPLLKSMASSSDIVIVLTDQISHKHVQVLDSAGIKYVRQTGGISRLKEFITNLYANK